MASIERTTQTKILLSEEEKDALRELAAAAGMSVSDYLRQLIRREHAKLQKR
ncbi:hypothetical protein AKJ09_08998 [Labilithrix luteola]|uniref:Uncharacterized protein n=1 Tax=Labilithrix luteola TaxID=1391654 RepID=A0A0K1QA99_9BACT|nr:ribbon-helix-helix protein, CopG family [Labilithrix luteola]AKV02335.1 hypothetical protein AKJ09_08998 [Labilithrix luteola]